MPDLARSPAMLGHIIQRTRKARGWTQTDLAQTSGLRQEMISRIETGHDGVRLSTVFALLAALDLDLVIDGRSAGSATEIEDIF